VSARTNTTSAPTATAPATAPSRHRTGLTIELATGVGRGPTAIAAFDAALREAGVHNYNLLRLSSVVPPGSEIQVLDGAAKPSGDWGDRLYVVMACEHASLPGEEAWAGIGWVQQAGSRKGLFVEHEGPSEQMVRNAIELSLDALTEGRSDETFGPHHQVLRGAVCEDGEPTCALAVAVFESQGWGPVIDLA
jgi:arginine decarboxylase